MELAGPESAASSVALTGLVPGLFCTHGRHQVAASGTEAANAEPHPRPPSNAEKHSFAFLCGGLRLFWIKRYGGKLWSNSNEAGGVSGHWIPEQPLYLSVCVSVARACPDSLWPHGLYSLWDSPGQNTGVGSLFLLQGIFPTQGSNPGVQHYRQILYQLNHKGNHCIWYPLNPAFLGRELEIHFELFFIGRNFNAVFQIAGWLPHLG